MTVDNAGRYVHQTGFFNPEQFTAAVELLGFGGIGGCILPTLATMGLDEFVIWDPDLVEQPNTATTLVFTDEHLYRPKVDVGKEYLLAHGVTKVTTHQERFTRDSRTCAPIVISAVDSMEARQEIWESVKASSTVHIYVDCRIGGEFWEVLIVDPLNPGWYEEGFLFDDSEAAELPCTQRAVVYPAVALGANLAALLARWSRGDAVPEHIMQYMGDPFFQTVGSQVI